MTSIPFFHDTKAIGEQILGSMLLDPKIFDDFSSLTENHFTEIEHKALFNVIQANINNHGTFSMGSILPTFSAIFEGSETTEKRGTVGEYLASLCSAPAFSSKQDKTYALDAMKDALARRETASLIGGLNEKLSSKESFLAMHDDFMGKLFKIGEAVNQNTEQRSWGELVSEYLEAFKKTNKEYGLISTGFPTLDEMLCGGFRPPEVIILGGATSMGKTSLAMNICVNVAKQGHGVGFFSMEMGNQQLMDRVMSDFTNIPVWVLRKRIAVTNQDMEKIAEASLAVEKLPIKVNYTQNICIDDLYRQAREWKRLHGIKLLVVDYLQLISPSTVRRNGTRAEEIATVSGMLKALASELNIPILLLVQLNRALAHRENPRPTHADISESGRIAQDADVVLLVHREEYYLHQKKPPEDNTAEMVKWEDKMQRVRGKGQIIIAKNRQGALEDIEVNFCSKTTRFYED